MADDPCKMTVPEISRRLLSSREALDALGLAEVHVFGSVARGEATEESDIDLLVSFDRPVGLFQLGRTLEVLNGILGRRIDLVTSGGLRPEYRNRVLKEAIRAA